MENELATKLTPEKYYAQFSQNYLQEMHESARRAYEHDRKLTSQQKAAAQNFRCPLAYYGTDTEKDWPEHVDAIEKALSDMQVVYTPIVK